MVTVMVGQQPAVKFLLHRSVSLQSSFLRVAVTGFFQESITGTVPMPEDDPVIFKIYQHWLYYKEILDDLDEPMDGARHDKLFTAYILGDKLGDFAFMNTVIDAIIYLSNTLPAGRTFPNHRNIAQVYNNIASMNSPIKRLLVDQVVYGGDATWFTEGTMQYLPQEYMTDVIQELLVRRPAPGIHRDGIAFASNYHVDNTGHIDKKVYVDNRVDLDSSIWDVAPDGGPSYQTYGCDDFNEFLNNLAA